MEPKQVNDAAQRTVVSTRIFNTNQKEMFDAWTDPAKLARWWGPKGFTNTFNEFDPTPGGKWNFVMHGPNGVDYRNECIFVKVAPNEVVIEHVSWPKFILTGTFEPVGKQTKLIFNQEFATIEDYEKVKPVVVPANEENFDRLEIVLR